jgi:prepilin-type N-terminal cleavage/methylation domain-containing protein
MRLHSEAGFSLAEILITIVIVAVTFTAILGGLMTSITVSALHRKEATADTLARDAGESVKDSVLNPYKTTCAGPSMYSLPAPPSGYTVSVTTVMYWDGGSSYPIAFGTTCPGGVDKGLQQITILARSTDDSARETVEIIKRIVT